MRYALWLLAGFSSGSFAATITEPSEKLVKLQKLSASTPLIRLNTATYDEFTAGARDYSISIVLTALSPQFKCVPCQQFQPQHRELARQWSRKAAVAGTDRQHFFAYLDFPDGQDIFRRVFSQLSLSTAPVAQYWTANANESRGKVTPDNYDFRLGIGAPEYSRWVLSHLPNTQFTFSKPVNYTAIGSTLFMLTFIAFTLFRNWTTFAPFLQGKIIWALGSLAVILLMISGRMWCQIRHAPLMTAQGMIAAGYSNQYGIEVYIVASIYAVLAFAAYALAVLVPSYKSPQAQRLTIYIWIGVLITVHSVLIGLFKTKNPGYPFSLLI